MEDAVRREVREETGVVVDDVAYHCSQPWPAGPSSQLMLGSISVAKTEAIHVNTTELEAARWVDLSEIREILAGAGKWSPPTGTAPTAESGKAATLPLVLPPPEAVAHQLLVACATMGP